MTLRTIATGVTAICAIALVSPVDNPAAASDADDTRATIKACKALEAFASRTANDRFVEETPLSDALLNAAGDPVREKIVLEAYEKGPREIGNGGRAFGEQVFRQCFAAGAPEGNRTTRELMAENDEMRHEALTHWAMAIQKKLRENWERPDDAVDGWSCMATIRMEQSGEVKTIDIERCDGTRAFRESVRSAIETASPLPRPAIRSVWQETIRLDFRPQ